MERSGIKTVGFCRRPTYKVSMCCDRCMPFHRDPTNPQYNAVLSQCLSYLRLRAGCAGDRERRVAFRDSRDIDFSLVPVAAIQQMIGQQIPVEIADVFWRGFRILVDKDRLAEQLTDSSRWPEKAHKLPTELMWRETGQDFLYHALLAAKKGELWVATSSCKGSS